MKQQLCCVPHVYSFLTVARQEGWKGNGGDRSKSLFNYLYSFTVHVVIVHYLKTQLMHSALK